jgi:hypothetical protein
VTSAILTGSLLTKATGRHDRLHYAGSPDAGSADVEARSSPKLALEPQQRADCDENKLRLLRGQAGRRGQALGKPAGGFRASFASRTPEGQPRAVAEALATLTTPGADSSIKKL